MSLPALNFVPPVIAHRGARNRAPENTMAAFRAAQEDGARWIETDVKLTADGVPVLFHDDTLDRTTDARGPVAAKTRAELRERDAGRWFGAEFAGTKVPLLSELLTFALETGMRLNLELKPCPGRAQATAIVSLIEVAKLWPNTAPPPLISSFDIESLMIAARLHPGWPRGLLLDDWREDWREVMTLTRADALHINEGLLTAERLRLLRETGVPILAYTVNDAARARHLLANGVRAVFCDNPGAMITQV